MKIVTTFHQPSSVITSLKCKLSSGDVEHLVVAKLNCIQVYSLQQSALSLQCTLEIQGKVTSIRAIPIPRSTRSNLLVLLAHPDPELIFLSYAESEDGLAELQPTKQLSLLERTSPAAEFFNDVLVHPSGALAIASCYKGKLKVINLKAGRYQDDFDVSLPEMNLFSMCFLPLPDDEYAVALAHYDQYSGRIQLLCRDVELEDLQLSFLPSTHLHTTPISKKVFSCPAENPPTLIPIFPVVQPAEEDSTNQTVDFPGGVLIAGGRSLLLYELVNEKIQEKHRDKRRRTEAKKKSKDAVVAAEARKKEQERNNKPRKPKGSVTWPWSDFSAWGSVDNDSSKIFLADTYGRLSLLSLQNLNEFGLALIPLGEVSPPTSLTYLTNQILYIGSHMGDPQVVQISQTPTSSTDSPTLPIPRGIRTVEFDRSSKKKGKGRADPDLMDMDMDDDDDSMPEAAGNIIATKGSYINVLEQLKNIAPIYDAALIETDGGQRHIVTCSGGRNTGSLNFVRSGADFQELATIPGVPHVLKIWSFRSRLEDNTDSFLLLSFYDESRLIKIQDEDDLEFIPVDTDTGVIINEPTLAFANMAQRVKGPDGRSRYMNSTMVVQVTKSGAFLLNLDEVSETHSRIASWDVKTSAEDAQAEVVAASINSSQIALAISGGKLVLLSISDDKQFKINVSSLRSLRQPEISAVSCTPLNSTQAFSQFIVVSYWESNTIEVFKPTEHGFQSVFKTGLLPSLVSSLLFYNFGSDNNSKGADYYPYLLAGLSDGSVATFVWNAKQLTDKKVLSLGHAPVDLIPCEVDGTRTILAAGNRAVVFSHERSTLVHSPILLKNIKAATALHTPSLQSSMVFASCSELHIGRIKDLNKLHIRSLPFGLDTPRKITYQPLLKAFGVGFTRSEPTRVGDDDDMSMSSSFKLIDESTFEVLVNLDLDAQEIIASIMPITTVIDDVTTPLFVVGTCSYNPEESEPSSGRILILSVSTLNNPRTGLSYEISTVTTAEVKGSVYALTPIIHDNETKIIASVNSSVVLFHLNIDSNVVPSRLELQKVTEWNHNYVVTSLGSCGDHVFVGDQISSVSMLKVPQEESKFETVARDYGPRWPVALDGIDEKNVIGANDALNLFTFTLTQSLGRIRNVLECTGDYHIAELVNKFIRGSIVTSDEKDLKPETLFFTSSGRIGVIVNVENNDLSIQLTELQRNMGFVVPTVGGISHARFRAPKSTRGRSDADQASFGFIDGDFLEKLFSDIGSEETIKKVWQGQTEPEKLSFSVDEIRRLLEDLQSCH